MSLLLRPGYFFTLMYASALAGAACVPLVAPDLFGLPAVTDGSILVAGLVCACGLILRWPTIRGLTLTYLGVLIVLTLFSASTLPSPLSVSWTVLGSVCTILLLVFLRSRMLRTYLART